MKHIFFSGLLALLLISGAYAYAEVIVVGDYDEPSSSKTIVYDESRSSRNSYSRGYDDGFEDGYDRGYVDGVDRGKESPYNRYYGKCDDIDDWDDWEDCYGDFRYMYPGFYTTPIYTPIYPYLDFPYRHSQYSYAAQPCTVYGYSRYC